jgi:hypothetical protein
MTLLEQVQKAIEIFFKNYFSAQRKEKTMIAGESLWLYFYK